MPTDHKHRGKAELLRVLKSRELFIDELQDHARRLLGWRLLYEKRGSTYSSGRRDVWHVARSPLMTKPAAVGAVRALRKHGAARNVRVLRVYRKKSAS